MAYQSPPEREHMIKDHGFSDFGMFGDTPKEQDRYLPGAHGQMHEYEQPNHEHEEPFLEFDELSHPTNVDQYKRKLSAWQENPRPDLYNDRRQEGRRNAPR